MTDHWLETNSFESAGQFDRSPPAPDVTSRTQGGPDLRQSDANTLPIEMTKVRLGYLTGQYPRATDTFIQREVETLRSLGYLVQTFAVRKPPETENVGAGLSAERNSTIYLLPPAHLLRAHMVQLLSAPRRYLSAILLAARTCPPGTKAMGRQIAYFAEAGMLAQLMKKHSLSHLHNHFADSSGSVAMIAAELGGFTFSFTMHGPAEFYEAKLWSIDEKVRRALFVNCISHFCRSQAMVFAPVDCWGKLKIVHCGVDPSLFEVKRHAGKGRRLLFVGRLVAAKGLPILLKALATLEGIQLEVVGDGPDRKMLEDLAQSLGLSNRVEFLGYQSQADVRELLKQTDVFALSSFAEGVPVVLMEAMAAGIPVVATRIAGIPELVQHEKSGLLVAPGDPVDIARAIRLLLEDPELRNRYASAGRKRIEAEFDINGETRWLATILTNALAGNEIGLRRQEGNVSN
ncbi:MAG TPA: glycosyltransferase family 4 protein [Chthoniobacterales bacterium]|nr:glycosyltransferase family 4 protein [Chthoniobacterales bacterium]